MTNLATNTLRADVTGSDVQPSETPSDPSRWIGYIEGYEGSVVHGWCCDIANVDSCPSVEVVASNGARLVATAGIFREDVKRAGIGNGKYGFRIDVAELRPGNEPIFLRFADSKVPIGEPVALDPRRAILASALPRSFLDQMQQLAAELRLKHAEMKAADYRYAAQPR